jgi:rhamnose transport system substrate-binding protein
MNIRTLPLALAAISLSFVLGCGSTKNDSVASGSATSATAGKKTKIVFIPKSAGNPYFTQVEAGFKSSADQFGIEFASQAPSSADATSQLSVIKDQTQRGAEVIVISPNSPDALNQALDQAAEKGVIIITADSDLTGNESHRSVGVVPVDFSTIGPEQVELLGSQINYEGEIAILSATSDAPNQNAWIAGMKETLAQSKYAKMKLVEVVYGDDEPQKSTTECEALLTKHPNLKGMIVPTSVGLAAAAQVLTQKEIAPGAKNAKNGGLVLTGLGTPNELRKAIEAGVVAKFQLWDPADIGTVAAFLGTQLKSKKLESKPGTKFEIPGKGSFEIKEKNIVVAGKLVTFTKDNIGQYKF